MRTPLPTPLRRKVLLAALLLVSACASATTGSGNQAASVAPSSAGGSPASPGPIDLAAVDLCSLLTPSDIGAALGADVGDGQYGAAVVEVGCHYSIEPRGEVATTLSLNTFPEDEWRDIMADLVTGFGAESIDGPGIIRFVRLMESYPHADRPPSRVIMAEVVLTEVALTVLLDDIQQPDDDLKVAAVELLERLTEAWDGYDAPRVTPEPTPTPIATAAPATGRCDDRLSAWIAHIADGLRDRREAYAALEESSSGDVQIFGLMALGSDILAEADWFTATVPGDGELWPAIADYGVWLREAADAWAAILGDSGGELTDEQARVALGAFDGTGSLEDAVRHAGDACN